MKTKESFCSIGLLAHAAGADREAFQGSKFLLAEIIVANYPDRVPCNEVNDITSAAVITVFNDHKDTTFEDVERMFQKAEVAWDEHV